MEPKDLLRRWTEPDNTKLTPRQISIRLPLHVAAKISALCDRYPTKSRTEIIGDLLSSALEQVVEAMSPGVSEEEAEEMGNKGIDPGDVVGEQRRFLERAQKYEKELSVEADEVPGENIEHRGRTESAEHTVGSERAPRQRGASAQPTKPARPAAVARGDQRGRKRETAGGRRSR